MKKAALLLLILPSALYASDLDQETWLKETLTRRLEESEKYDLDQIKERNEEILTSSRPCFTSNLQEEESALRVFMTFDAPLAIWQEYSEDLQKIGGTFVLRGLPGDSFLEFGRKIRSLRERGVTAPIQIDPKLFQRFHVEKAPTILLVDGENYDKITGSVSIQYSLEQFEQKGDTKISSEYLSKLSGDFL